jgi:hypothetical protein
VAEDENTTLILVSLAWPGRAIRWKSATYSTSVVGGKKAGNDVVTRIYNGSNLNVCAEAMSFVRHNRAYAVHGGFIGRGRFDLNEYFEHGYHPRGLRTDI